MSSMCREKMVPIWISGRRFWISSLEEEMCDELYLLILTEIGLRAVSTMTVSSPGMKVCQGPLHSNTDIQMGYYGICLRMFE